MCTVPGPVSDLSAIPEVAEVIILWDPPSELNGIIIVYEVCSNTSGVFSYTNTSATQHTLRDLPPNTVVTFSVRAYTIIGPGEYVTGQTTTGSVRECIKKSCIISLTVVLSDHLALVSGITVVTLSSTSVRVSWTPVNLTVVDHYTVHYTTMGGVNSTVSFPATSSSGVVSGLQGGETYRFSVSITLNVNGELYIGSSNYTLPQVTCELSTTSQFFL